MSQPGTPIRGALLQSAMRATLGDRDRIYGSPIEQFTRHAELCSAYFGRSFSPHDIAIILCLCKLSRIPGSPTHEDSYIDLAAYGAIAGEMAALGAYRGAPEKISTHGASPNSELLLKSSAAIEPANGGAPQGLPGQGSTFGFNPSSLNLASTGNSRPSPAERSANILDITKKP